MSKLKDKDIEGNGIEGNYNERVSQTKDKDKKKYMLEEIIRRKLADQKRLK